MDRDFEWDFGWDDEDDGMELGEAALKGALAALVGGVALKLAWEAGDRSLPLMERYGSPTLDAVDLLASRAGVNLNEVQRQASGVALYGGAMATWGAVYGMVHSRVRPPALLHGLVLGALVYAANFTKASPLRRTGIVPSYDALDGAQRAVPLAAHVVFGLTTAAVFEALSD